MINFSNELTVPANTLESLPVTSTVKVDKGKIIHMSLSFNAGCNYTVHVVIEARGMQVAPIIAGQSFAFDYYTKEIECDIPMEYPPYEITVKAWSPATKYPHTIYSTFDLEPSEDSNVLTELRNLLAVKHV